MSAYFERVQLGYFQNILQVFLKHSSRKNYVSQFKFPKKQVRIKELENRDEAKWKARSYFNFFIWTFEKEKKKTSGKTTKQERLGKTIVEK